MDVEIGTGQENLMWKLVIFFIILAIILIYVASLNNANMIPPNFGVR